MLNVMFENSNGQLRIIGTVENEESAFKVINDFLDDHNYKSYYQRTWKKDDKTKEENTIMDFSGRVIWCIMFYLKIQMVN